jgi:prepilin-type N-terminal cleavage/methylation domain-containing protein
MKEINQKGFSLIEVLAVFVMVGILAAIAIPKYFSMVDKAQQNAALGAIGALESQAIAEYSVQLVSGQGTIYIPTQAPAQAIAVAAAAPPVLAAPALAGAQNLAIRNFASPAVSAGIITAQGITVGNFTGSIVNNGGTITVSIIAAPSEYAASNWAGTYGSKSFKLY